MPVESAKGECNHGQHEVNFRYRTELEMADNHTIYKNAAKEIASQEGCSLTFMAKFNELEGNSCHLHFSLRGTDGEPVFSRRPRHELELAAFGAAVTDWERYRGFERM